MAFQQLCCLVLRRQRQVSNTKFVALRKCKRSCSSWGEVGSTPAGFSVHKLSTNLSQYLPVMMSKGRWKEISWKSPCFQSACHWSELLCQTLSAIIIWRGIITVIWRRAKANCQAYHKQYPGAYETSHLDVSLSFCCSGIYTPESFLKPLWLCILQRCPNTKTDTQLQGEQTVKRWLESFLRLIHNQVHES